MKPCDLMKILGF